MKNMKIMLYKSNQKRDGSYPVCLRISKDGKRKYISLGLSAQGVQWNDDADRFKKDTIISTIRYSWVLYTG